MPGIHTFAGVYPFLFLKKVTVIIDNRFIVCIIDNGVFV